MVILGALNQILPTEYIQENYDAVLVFRIWFFFHRLSICLRAAQVLRVYYSHGLTTGTSLGKSVVLRVASVRS